MSTSGPTGSDDGGRGFRDDIASGKISGMIICHSRQFVLIRPRKVASSSVQAAFVPFLAAGDQIMRLDLSETDPMAPIAASIGYDRRRWPLVLRQHSSLARLVTVMGRQVLDYKIVTLARNPWDRAVSEFFYDTRTQNFRSGSASDQRAAFGFWLRRNAFLPPLRRLISRLEGGNRISKLEQSALCVVQGSFRADHVIFYEDLAGGLQRAGEALRLDLQLPARKAKAGIRSEVSHDWRSFYTDDSRDLLARACKTDIERYGYRFSGG